MSKSGCRNTNVHIKFICKTVYLDITTSEYQLPQTTQIKLLQCTLFYESGTIQMFSVGELNLI